MIQEWNPTFKRESHTESILRMEEHWQTCSLEFVDLMPEQICMSAVPAHPFVRFGSFTIATQVRVQEGFVKAT
jgi:hypothetical protein